MRRARVGGWSSRTKRGGGGGGVRICGSEQAGAPQGGGRPGRGGGGASPPNAAHHGQLVPAALPYNFVGVLTQPTCYAKVTGHYGFLSYSLYVLLI